MNVQQIMSTHPACCMPAATIEEVARMMADCDCGEIPVVDGDGKPMPEHERTAFGRLRHDEPVQLDQLIEGLEAELRAVELREGHRCDLGTEDRREE